MTRSRIVIPAMGPELTTPDFEDEATLITARPVVPIARAKAAERSRVSLVVGIGLLGMALVGVGGAIAVNYFEKQNQIQPLSTTRRQLNQAPMVNKQPATLPRSGEQAAVQESPGGGATSGKDDLASSQTQESSAQPEASAAPAPPAGDSLVITRGVKPRAAESRNSANDDPGHLVRKRRVHPVNNPDESPAEPEKPVMINKNKARGAAHIQEIFQGPNP